MITASILYDFIQCPHRIHMDRFGNAGDRDEVSPFIELLWNRGTAYELKVIESLEIPFVDLSAIEENDQRAQCRTILPNSISGNLIKYAYGLD